MKRLFVLICALILLTACGSAEAQSIVQIDEGRYNCLLRAKSNGGFRQDCDPADLSPTDTEPAPTDTEVAPTETVVSPTEEPEPTDTPIASEHDLFAWHEPDDHHHGCGLDDMHPLIAQRISESSPRIPLIGFNSPTSSSENAIPGKHSAHFWLCEEDTGRDQFDNGGQQEPSHTILAYAQQSHSMGTADAWRTRFHSERIVALACHQNNPDLCGIFDWTGRADYGQAHTSYKREVCWPDPANPFPMSFSQADEQPPYRTYIGSEKYGIFWSTLINDFAAQFFDPVPSNIVEVAWTELSAWEAPSSGDGCYDPSQDVPKNGRGNQYQVFSIYLHLSQFDSLRVTGQDFVAFTDDDGYLNPSCVDVGPGCNELFIGKDVPSGLVYLNRQVTQGDSDKAPIQVFGEDAPLIMNPYRFP